MSARNIGIIYRKELRDGLRDRRTLASMVLIPVLVMPALTIGMAYISIKMVSKARREVAKVMVLGGEDSPRVMAGLRQVPRIELVPPRPDYADLITEKKIRAAVEIPPGFDAALNRGEPATVQIYIYERELRSMIAAQRLEQFFRRLRDGLVQERLVARNLSESFVKPFEIAQKNVVSPEKVYFSTFGAILPYMIILLCMTGAMYPAMDLTAGEKERGTIETILSSPVSRSDLVLGKFLMVLSASLATAVLSFTSMAFSFRFAKGMTTELGPNPAAPVQLTVQPKAILAIFALVLPLAVLFSGALLAISLFAKSFKEAQSYISPLMIVVIVPAAASVLPGIELTPRLALVPILNTSLASKEIITGTYHWHYIALIFFSSCLLAVLALAAAVKLFQREDVLFRT